jgi:hypothetical protein
LRGQSPSVKHQHESVSSEGDSEGDDEGSSSGSELDDDEESDEDEPLHRYAFTQMSDPGSPFNDADMYMVAKYIAETPHFNPSYTSWDAFEKKVSQLPAPKASPLLTCLLARA